MTTTEAPSTNLKEIIKQSYDKIAPAYLQWSLSGPSPRPIYLKHLLDNLTAGSKVLELGCGNGYPVTQALCETENIGEIIANDISEQQIKLTRERCLRWSSKLELIAGDMMALNFGEGSLDGVAAFFSIFHLPKNEQQVMFRKIHSWLRPGAILVCNLGTEDTGTDETARPWTHFQADMYWSGLGIDGSKKTITKAGFELLAADVLDATEDKSDPDYGTKFLWIVAKKAET